MFSKAFIHLESKSIKIKDIVRTHRHMHTHIYMDNSKNIICYAGDNHILVD